MPILLAKAQHDRNAPAITFVDPSFDDDFWTDPEQVRTWFKSFGVEEHIVHHQMTTEQFAATEACSQLPRSTCCSSTEDTSTRRWRPTSG